MRTIGALLALNHREDKIMTNEINQALRDGQKASGLCQHEGNYGYSNHIIFCLDCDGVLKDNASYEEFEKFTARKKS